MKTEEMLDIISEAESFIDRHSEPWYRSGQELLARVRGLEAALAGAATYTKADVGAIERAAYRDGFYAARRADGMTPAQIAEAWKAHQDGAAPAAPHAPAKAREDDARDARRYRFLRNSTDPDGPRISKWEHEPLYPSPALADQLIDAALATFAEGGDEN